MYKRNTNTKNLRTDGTFWHNQVMIQVGAKWFNTFLDYTITDT